MSNLKSPNGITRGKQRDCPKLGLLRLNKRTLRDLIKYMKMTKCDEL